MEIILGSPIFRSGISLPKNITQREVQWWLDWPFQWNVSTNHRIVWLSALMEPGYFWNPFSHLFVFVNMFSTFKPLESLILASHLPEGPPWPRGLISRNRPWVLPHFQDTLQTKTLSGMWSRQTHHLMRWSSVTDRAKMQPREEQGWNTEGVAMFEETRGALGGWQHAVMIQVSGDRTEAERQEKRGSNDYRLWSEII